jgi:tetratricopeptide (TPR) repeat protein
MPSSAQQKRSKSRVVLIGWDVADWALLNPLLDSGSMPNLAALIGRGVMGKMATIFPSLSPLLWTSVATGVRPDRHRILGFTEPDPITGQVRPVSSTSRKAKAIWNTLQQQGLRSIVANWPAGHPAEPINGVIVSDAYPKSTAPYGAKWPVPQGSVHPTSLAEPLGQLRVHAGDLGAADLALFIPQLDRIDQSKDSRPAILARILAENISVHAAVTWLMENEEWDFLAAFYSTLGQLRRVLLPLDHAASDEGAQQDAELYKDVVDGLLRFQDLMLGRIMQLAGPDTVIMLVSGDRFQFNHLLGTTAAARPFQPTPLQRQAYGILCMAGPGVRHDELIYGSHSLDVAPTALTMLGLPIGRDMPGRVLTEALDQSTDLKTIPSWEDVSGECGRHVDQDRVDNWDSAEALRHLAELGYADLPNQKAKESLRHAQLYHDFNLARVYLASGRPADALPLFEGLVNQAPEELSIRLYLAQCYFELGRNEECCAAAEAVLRKERDRPVAEMILANVCLADGRIEEGLRLLLQAQRRSRTPGISYLIGRAFVHQNRFEDAAGAFRSALELDSDHAPASEGLARCLLEQGKYEEAAEWAMDAIRLEFDMPSAHYILGVALANSGRMQRAAQAFETCLALRPASPEARRWLATIQEQGRENAEASRVR